MNTVTAQDIADMIDVSLLNPTFTLKMIEEGCETAMKYRCVSVCLRPADVKFAANILKASDVKVTTVVGFPHGSNDTATKVFETLTAVNDGCVEVDVVLNIGRLLSGDLDFVQKDLQAVVREAHAAQALVKVIFENAYLTDEQKRLACRICTDVGADYTKTSTGYAPGGATVHDLKLMRANTPPSMRLKAAGGVRTLDDALIARAVGVSRFGCTRTETIMNDAYRREADGTLILPTITDDTELASVIAAREMKSK